MALISLKSTKRAKVDAWRTLELSFMQAKTTLCEKLEAYPILIGEVSFRSFEDINFHKPDRMDSQVYHRLIKPVSIP